MAVKLIPRLNYCCFFTLKDICIVLITSFPHATNPKCFLPASFKVFFTWIQSFSNVLCLFQPFQCFRQMMLVIGFKEIFPYAT